MQENFSIKEMPEEDRPEEKCLKLGTEALSNAELLALIIRTGNKSKTSVELSQEILNKFSCKDEYGVEHRGISALKNVRISDLTAINGIGKSKACMILAAVTLAKRMSQESVFKKTKVNSPSKIADYVMEDMSSLKVEEFKIAILNTKKELEVIKNISTGSIDMTVVHPREVFKTAIDYSAHTIIAIHNHPSGDITPSREDIALTKRLKEVGNIVGIELVDHIIIGNRVYYSFLENGII